MSLETHQIPKVSATECYGHRLSVEPRLYRRCNLAEYQGHLRIGVPIELIYIWGNIDVRGKGFPVVISSRYKIKLEPECPLIQ